MASVNKVIIIGNLGRDPETRYMPDGGAITNISLATTETWKDKNGDKQEKTEWHRVAFFGKLAEIAGEYLKKGSQCYVEGRLQTRKWQDKDGQDKYTTEIVADRMQMLGSRQGMGGGDRGGGDMPERESSGGGGGGGGAGSTRGRLCRCTISTLRLSRVRSSSSRSRCSLARRCCSCCARFCSSSSRRRFSCSMRSRSRRSFSMRSASACCASSTSRFFWSACSCCARFCSSSTSRLT